MADLNVNIGRLALKNPVMTASGTFGYGMEFQDFIPLDGLGGIIVKGTTLHPREGNDYPRMAETAQGMLNCVGLQNKVDYFCEHIYPQIRDIDTNMIVNVSGSSPDEYAACAERIDSLERIPAIELNISCPNVKDGGMAFGVTCAGAESVVKAVRERYHKTLIVKLSPNVTNIADIARCCEAQGADSVSLINTLMGMAIDIERRRPLLSIGTGGLSGPAVKPVALRMVWQVARETCERLPYVRRPKAHPLSNPPTHRRNQTASHCDRRRRVRQVRAGGGGGGAPRRVSLRTRQSGIARVCRQRQSRFRGKVGFRLPSH